MSQFTKRAVLGILSTILMLFPMTMKSQGYSLYGQATDSQGRPAAYAPVRVCPYTGSGIPCSPLSTIYSDLAETQPIANPYTTDVNGNYSFFVTSNATYILQITVAGRVYSYFASAGDGGGGAVGITSVNGGAGPAITINCAAGLTCTISGNTTTVSLSVPFSITSFSGCAGTVELGTSIVNPTFTAAYSTAPASASITNTDGVNSPLILSSPFTTGTVSGTFTHTSAATTTFTLSATQGSTQTANCTDSWKPAIFGGVGTAGATSSVTASGTTAVLSNGNVLPRTQLGAEAVGQTFGPYSPTNQVVYLLLTGGSHTFVDANTGFPFAMNAPIPISYVNAQGETLTMYLYSSVNPLFVPVAPKVAS